MAQGGIGWRAACWALGVLCATSVAQAEYRHRILVLERADSDEAGHEVTTRVRAELGAAGFDVMVMPVTEPDPKQAVEATGPELHPASVLLVVRQEGGTELWLADRMLRKTVVLRLKSEAAEPAADASGHDAARVAVQAVELVKARLAELALTREQSAAAAPRPSPPPPAPPAKETRGSRPNLTLAAGLLEGFQKGQQALTPVLRLGVTLPEAWTGEILALDARGGFIGLGQTARIEHGPGAATVRHTAVALDAVVRFLPRRRVQPFVGLGLGMLALDVTGVAPDPYRNSSKRTLSGVVEASGGLWLQPINGFGLALEGQLLDAWSKTIVRIANEDAAEVAAPLLLLSAGLMVEF